MQRLIGILLATTLAPATHAALRVRIVTGPGAAPCLTNASLVATNDARDVVHARVPLVREVGSYQVALPESGSVLIEVRAEKCWSETRTVSAQEREPVTLHLYPAGSVTGSFEIARGRPEVKLSARLFRLGPAGVKRAELDSAGDALTCSVEDLRWTCTVPADVPFDLALSPRGYATIRYWNIVAQPEQTTELEPKPLIPGASLAGWVRDAADRPLPKARLLLAPLEAQSPDTTHLASRTITATADDRGFFQFSGLEAGRFRLVSQGDAVSPAIVPAIELREGEELVWPRSIIHPPYATLTALIDPPRDRDGKRWTVELAEREPLYPGSPSRTVSRQATEDGQWEGRRLVADKYVLQVLTDTGSVLQRMDVDLSAGGPMTVNVPVHDILVRGTLMVGSDPIEADLRFSNGSGFVQTFTDAAGHFEVGFPAAGRWSAAVQYPRKRSGARIQAPAIEVSADGAPVEIRLPGGRIRGSVVDPDGRVQKAAVHIARDGRLAAQQLTDDDGKFDLLGLPKGSYALDAEGMVGHTARPLEIELDEDQSTQVELILQPYRTIRGTVFLPNGAPASGAVVRFSVDGGKGWSRIITDVEGGFQLSVGQDAPDVQLIVLTFDHPSAMVRVPTAQAERVRVVLGRRGGIVRARNASVPYVVGPGVTASMGVFQWPEPWGQYGGGVFLETGTYRLCSRRKDGDDCRQFTVTGGEEIVIDFGAASAVGSSQ